jgi:tetratricopeptide (TPR) repeat protein
MNEQKAGDRTWINEEANRFEKAWKADNRPRIEDYLAEASAPRRAKLFEELLRVERELLVRAGDAPAAEEYRDRFPDHAEIIDLVFGVTPRKTPGSSNSSSAAGRNLLFGLLALQNNFITLDQLVAAVNAWVRDKTKALGRILVEQGALQESRHTLLDALVQEHLRQHGDDPEQSLGALSSIGSARKDLEAIVDPDVQASLPRVSSAHRADDDPYATPTFSWGRSTSGGGRFRILRFHAKGGMGEVYVAQDEELSREVALKQIQEKYADDEESRSRFVVEAEITGGLEHPGIVPVYGLGQYANGRPYYAMRFLREGSLKDAIAEFYCKDSAGQDPQERALEFRKLLGRFVDVCDVIEYAHSRRVLHRDLKPGNVMLGRYGETLVVDWGLAKCCARSESSRSSDERTFRPPSASGDARTLAGSAVGTPAYMSPEQAAGKNDQLCAATDVYSLGAILYSLLTGAAPFPNPRSDAEVHEVLERVRRGDFPPPRQARQCVDRALDAVCLKAMALRPEDRYESPQALADEVERWLADEPVGAWREPWRIRAWRWLRRNRTAAAAIAAALVVAIGLGVGGAFWLAQHRQRRMASLHSAVARVQTLRDRAAHTADLSAWHEARSVADQAVDQFADLRSTALGGHLASLASAIAGEERDAEADHALLADLVDIRSARIDLGEGGVSNAYAAAFRSRGYDLTATATVQRLKSRPASIVREVVGFLDDWAMAELRSKPKSPQATQVLDLARGLDPDRGRDRFRSFLAGRSQMGLADRQAVAARSGEVAVPTALLAARALMNAGDHGTALTALERAAVANPDDPWVNFELAERLAAARPPRTEEAIGYYRAARARRPETAHELAHLLDDRGHGAESVEVFRDLTRRRPKNSRHRVCLGDLLKRRGADGAAAKELQQAIELARGTLEADPRDAVHHMLLGLALHDSGDLKGAISAHREAIRIKPDSAEVHYNLGNALRDSGDLKGAIAAFREAIRIKPDSAEAHYNLGYALRDSGDLKGAIAAFREAIRIKPNFAAAHNALGAALRESGDSKGAIAAFREAIRLKPDYAEDYNNLGVALRDSGDLKGAIAACREAIRIKPDYAEAHSNLGIALRDSGDLKGAIAAHREAIRIKPDYAEAHSNLGAPLSESKDSKGAIAAYREAIRLKPDFAMAHYNLGNALRDSGDWEGAIVAFREAIRITPEYAEAHCNLGLALLSVGEFRESLEALSHGHDLGSRQPGWAYPSLAWVERVRQLVAFEEKFDAIRTGKGQPGNPEEAVALAEVALAKKLPAAAARFYAAAFDARPTLANDLASGHRYNATCAAALGGCGQGRDEPRPGSAERAAPRQRALEWLRADLTAWTRVVVDGPPALRQKVVPTLEHWKEDTDLTGIRDRAELAKLPEAERAEFRRFWADVDELVRRASGGTARKGDSALALPANPFAR